MMMGPRFLVLLAAFAAPGIYAGCSGGSSGGGGGAPLANTDPEPPRRLDTEGGNSPPAESLQDGKPHLFEFPTQPGATFDINIVTTPPTTTLTVRIEEFNATGIASGLFLGTRNVTTPFALTINPTTNTKIRIHVEDEDQQSLTLSSISALQTSLAFSPTTFPVVIHIVGAETAINFSGYGFFNDLATPADELAFANDLISRVNAIFAPTGIQIDVANSRQNSITIATVDAAEPGLVGGGVLSELNTTAAAGTASDPARWGNLGIPASDPTFGNVLDIFIVSQAINSAQIGRNNGVIKDTINNSILRQGGVLRGNGLQHSVVFAAFDLTAAVVPPATLAAGLAHEIGHFLSLYHPAEAGKLGCTPGPPAVCGSLTVQQAVTQALFQGLLIDGVGQGFWKFQRYDGVTESTLADDKPAGQFAGELDFDPSGAVTDDSPLPDELNVMFLVADATHTQWGIGQTRALRSYLEITEH